MVALSVINWFMSLSQEQQLKVIKILLLLFKYGFHWYKSKHCKVNKDNKGHVNNKKEQQNRQILLLLDIIVRIVLIIFK